MNDRVYVGTCDLGRGVFSKSKIRKGEEFLWLEGPIVSFSNLVARGEAEANAIQIGPDEYIDVFAPGMYLNHSCNPNAGLVRDRFLLALRDIERDEEVRIDYSTTMQEDHWTMACRCGYACCRKVITDFRLLPSDTKHRYLVQGIVQNFIRQTETSRAMPHMATT